MVSPDKTVNAVQLDLPVLAEILVWMVSLAQMGMMAQMATAELKVQKDNPGLMVLLATEVETEQLDHLDLPEIRVHKVNQATLVLASKVSEANPDHLDLKETMDQLEIPVHKETMELKVIKVFRAEKETLVKLVLPEIQDLEDLLETIALETAAQPDLLDQMDSQAYRDYLVWTEFQVPTENMVNAECQVQKETQALLAHQETMANLDRRDDEDKMALTET